jgi:transposase
LDWADEEHLICLRDLGSEKVETSRIKQTPEALSEWVRGLRERFCAEGKVVAIALEQSHGTVIHHLMGYADLLLYPVNPKSLARYRESFFSSGAKDDPTDAELLLELVTLHRERLRAWRPDDELTRTISMLAQHRRKLVNNRTRVSNRMTALLKDYYPQALRWAGELDTVMACDYLSRWPTLEAVKRERKARLRKFYHQHGVRGEELIEGRISEIREALALTTDGALLRGCPVILEAEVSQMRSLIEAIRSVDKQLAGLYESHPDHDLFASLPGAGPALGPRLLTAYGSDRERYASAAELQQFSGIAPVTERSGKSLWVHRRLGCPKFLLQSFHEFAGKSILQSRWARAYYEQQRERGKKHHAAVRALAYKWIRIIFRCWKEGVQYSEEKYIESLRRRGSPLINHLVAAAPA